MLNWKKKHITPIGLDLGTNAIRGVQLARNTDAIHIYSALEVKSPLTESQDTPNDVDLSDDQTPHLAMIEQLISMGGFKGRNVTIHCPVTRLDMRPVFLPSGAEGLPDHAIRGAIQHQLAEHIPFPIDQAAIDYHILDHDAKSGQLHLIAVTADGAWIEKQINILKSVHLNCTAVLPMPHALAHLIYSKVLDNNHTTINHDQQNPPEPNELSTDPSGSLTGLLDIGYTGSTLIVLLDQCPLFCRRFPFSGNEMTSLLSQHLMIDLPQAEHLKIEFGLYNHKQSSQNESPAMSDCITNNRFNANISKTIFTALQTRLDEFIEGLIRSLNYVIAQNRNASMSRLLLSGTASHLPRLSDYMSDQLEIPVEPVSHFLLDEINTSLPGSRAFSGSWCMATALALASLPESAKRIAAKSRDQQTDTIPTKVTNSTPEVLENAELSDVNRLLDDVTQPFAKPESGATEGILSTEPPQTSEDPLADQSDDPTPPVSTPPMTTPDADESEQKEIPEIAESVSDIADDLNDLEEQETPETFPAAQDETSESSETSFEAETDKTEYIKVADPEINDLLDQVSDQLSEINKDVRSVTKETTKITETTHDTVVEEPEETVAFSQPEAKELVDEFDAALNNYNQMEVNKVSKEMMGFAAVMTTMVIMVITALILYII